MITIYYMCGGYALAYFTQFLKSVKQMLPDTEKRIVLITNDAQMTIYDDYSKENVSIVVKYDTALNIIPLNKVDELQKFIDNNSDYSIFINPNAKFVGFDAELLNDNKLYFGYIDKQEEQSSEHFGFGSLIYGKTNLFNQAIRYARDYEFVQDENQTDEQKFIRFIENNPSTSEYRESSDIYTFFE